MVLGVLLALSYCDSLGASICAVPMVRDTPPKRVTLLVVESRSDTQWRKMVRPAHHRSGNAAVVDTGWVRRGCKILGVSAKVTGDGGQPRVVDNSRSRHSREVTFIGVMLTRMNVLHFRFPSPDLADHVQ